MKNKKWILVVICGIMAVFPGKDAAAQGREGSIGGDVLAGSVRYDFGGVP